VKFFSSHFLPSLSFDFFFCVSLPASLVDMVYNQQLNRLATCGDDGVHIVDMADWKELKSEHKEFTREEGDAERMEWTKDGQILSVATSGGYVFNFLMAVDSSVLSDTAVGDDDSALTASRSGADTPANAAVQSERRWWQRCCCG
jgi:hypothetical protein